MCCSASSCRGSADRKSFLIFLTLPLRFRFLNRTSNKPWDGFETRISNVVISAISYFIRVPPELVVVAYRSAESSGLPQTSANKTITDRGSARMADEGAGRAASQ